jgi:hypothetical protein
MNLTQEDLEELQEISETDASLRFMTHDARKILKMIGAESLNIRWQVLLMELCYNYTYQKTFGIIKKEVDKKPGQSFGEVLSSISVFKFKNPIRNALFTPHAIRNLYIVDRRLLASDYDVHLNLLADSLNNVKALTLEKFVANSDPCSMWLFLSKLEHFLVKRTRDLEKMHERALIQAPDTKPMEEGAREILNGSLEEVKRIRQGEEKEE